MFEPIVYQTRREKLIKQMKLNGIAVFMGNTFSPMNYPANPYRFRQDSTFLYLFGIDEPDFIAIIDFDNAETILFGNDQTMDDIIWSGVRESVQMIGQGAGISRNMPLSAVNEYITTALAKKRSLHFLPQYRSENRDLLAKIIGESPDYVNSNFSLQLIQAIVPLRSAKDSHELAEIEKACTIGHKMHLFAMENAVEGKTEHQLAGLLEGIALSEGAGLSFPVILTQNGSVLHQHHHGGALQNGKLMLVDAGAETTMHYASDFTRTIPVGHRFSQIQRDIYNIVLNANEKARSLMLPGIRYKDVHLAASQIIAQGLIDLGIMKGNAYDAVSEGAHALFFPHGLGHLMGLDVHDMEDYGQRYVGFDEETRPSDQFGLAALRFGRRLHENYVMTIEPGIYFINPLIEKWAAERKFESFINYSEALKLKNFGGIRIEDDVIIAKGGAKIIGERLPVLPDDIGKLE